MSHPYTLANPPTEAIVVDDVTGEILWMDGEYFGSEPLPEESPILSIDEGDEADSNFDEEVATTGVSRKVKASTIQTVNASGAELPEYEFEYFMEIIGSSSSPSGSSCGTASSIEACEEATRDNEHEHRVGTTVYRCNRWSCPICYPSEARSVADDLTDRLMRAQSHVMRDFRRIKYGEMQLSEWAKKKGFGVLYSKLFGRVPIRHWTFCSPLTRVRDLSGMSPIDFVAFMRRDFTRMVEEHGNGIAGVPVLHPYRITGEGIERFRIFKVEQEVRYLAAKEHLAKVRETADLKTKWGRRELKRALGCLKKNKSIPIWEWLRTQDDWRSLVFFSPHWHYIGIGYFDHTDRIYLNHLRCRQCGARVHVHCPYCGKVVEFNRDSKIGQCSGCGKDVVWERGDKVRCNSCRDNVNVTSWVIKNISDNDKEGYHGGRELKTRNDVRGALSYVLSHAGGVFYRDVKSNEDELYVHGRVVNPVGLMSSTNSLILKGADDKQLVFSIDVEPLCPTCGHAVNQFQAPHSHLQDGDTDEWYMSEDDWDALDKDRNSENYRRKVVRVREILKTYRHPIGQWKETRPRAPPDVLSKLAPEIPADIAVQVAEDCQLISKLTCEKHKVVNNWSEVPGNPVEHARKDTARVARVGLTRRHGILTLRRVRELLEASGFDRVRSTRCISYLAHGDGWSVHVDLTDVCDNLRGRPKYWHKLRIDAGPDVRLSAVRLQAQIERLVSEVLDGVSPSVPE